MNVSETDPLPKREAATKAGRLSIANLTVAEIQADLDATERDITRLTAICENIRDFCYDSHGEDRSRYKIHVLEFDVLFQNAIILR